MPWLRFHAYGVGLPKTGSTSLSLMMRNYRTGHEVWLDFLAESAVARRRGEIDDAAFWETVQRRFVPLRAEMDAVTCHHLYVDVLMKHYPKAKFIVTYRDVRSWANSLLSLCIYSRRTPPDRLTRQRTWHLTYGDWVGEGTIPFDPADEGDDAVALPALMRTWAAYMRDMPTLLPPDQTMWIKTSELTARAPELADFLGIPADSLDMEVIHSNRTRNSLDRFAIADRATVDRAYAEHCADLMAEHFPAEHAAFAQRSMVDREEAWRDYLDRVAAEVREQK